MKRIVLLVGVSVVFVSGVLVLLVNKSKGQLSEVEIRDKFRCERITAEVLATDIYCQNPDYYYEDLKNGTVINSSDYEDPRYKTLYKSN